MWEEKRGGLGYPRTRVTKFSVKRKRRPMALRRDYLQKWLACTYVDMAGFPI
jgi:hypothetical protein